jgi:hypothetical protein
MSLRRDELPLVQELALLIARFNSGASLLLINCT